MRSLITKVALLATSFVVPALAHADVIKFTTADSTMTFSLPHSPTVDSASNAAFQLDGVQYVYTPNGGASVSGTASLFFFANGNFAYLAPALNTFLYATSASHTPVFSGTTVDPTFDSGIFDYTYDYDFGNTPGPDALLSNTPEPSSLLLMGTGFIGIFVAGRRRILNK